MSEEEIRKALEIIKQPITVHCEEYKYFDQENYDNLISVYDNCLWFVRNFEQIRETAIQIKEENTQLKKQLEITTFNFQSLSSACGSLAEFMGLDKDSIIEEMIDKVVKDRKEKDLYKSVLKEIREYIENRFPYLQEIDKEYEDVDGNTYFTYKEYDGKELLEIIDKGLKNDE